MPRTNPHVIAENQRRNRENDREELRGLIGDIGIRRSRDPNSPFYYDFQVPYANEQGQSAVVSTRIKPGLDRFIKIVMNHRLVPHHTVSEVLRHAIAEYAYKLGYLIDSGGMPETAWNLVFQIQKFKEDKKYRREVIRGISELEGMVNETQGDLMEIQAMRKFLDDQVVRWSDNDDTPMKDEILDLLAKFDKRLTMFEAELDE
jgi:hypothetical protein